MQDYNKTEPASRILVNETNVGNTVVGVEDATEFSFVIDSIVENQKDT